MASFSWSLHVTGSGTPEEMANIGGAMFSPQTDDAA